MAMRVVHEFTLESITATAYGSASYNEYFAFDRALDYAIQYRHTSVAGMGNVGFGLSDAIDNPSGDITPDWRQLAFHKQSAIESLTQTMFRPVSQTGLCPYGRAQVLIENTDAAVLMKLYPLTVKVLAELK
jgi:hypothetical protein